MKNLLKMRTVNWLLRHVHQKLTIIDENGRTKESHKLPYGAIVEYKDSR